MNNQGEFRADDGREMCVSAAIRVDRASMPAVTRTPEGYLRGDAVVTRLGVFRYRNPDGSERLELRHPDDVLQAQSLDSLKLIPITIDHPAALVSPANARELAVGTTGENYRIDGRHIVSPISITHADGIAAVQAGKRELSLGYAVDLVEETGTYNGEAYTHRQTNIRYNHLAIVDVARAGQAARINLDGAAVQSETHGSEDTPMSDAKLATVNLDGLEYQAAPEVAKALQKAQADLTAAQTNLDSTKADMQKEIDSLTAKLDEAKAKMKQMEDERGDSAIAARVKARVGLLATAGRFVKDAAELADKSEREIQVAVIAARHDGIDLTEKSDEYVQARFDAVVEAEPKRDDAAIDRQVEGSTDRNDGTEKKDARKDAADTVTGMWKNPSKKEGK